MATTHSFIKGNKLLVIADTSVLGYSTASTLSMTANTADVTCKETGLYGASEVTTLTWEITSENLYTTANFQGLVTKWQAAQPIKVVFGEWSTGYQNSGTTEFGGTGTLPTALTNSFSGEGFITSLSANANAGDNATYSITITGSGALSASTGA